MGSPAKISNGRLCGLSLLLLTCSCVGKQEQQVKTDSMKVVEQPASITSVAPSVASNDPVALQAHKLIQKLKDEDNYSVHHGPDTLIDIDGDGYKDLLIEFYGGSGTGLKNAADVYLYDVRSKEFNNEVISLANPTFYFDRKTIATYYVGMGGGYAYTFRWKGGQLDTVEYIDITVDNSKANPLFTTRITQLPAGKTRSKVTDRIALPSSYRYGDYTPLIKRSQQ